MKHFLEQKLLQLQLQILVKNLAYVEADHSLNWGKKYGWGHDWEVIG